MNTLKVAVVIICSAITARFFIVQAIKLLKEADCTTVNYKHNKLVVGTGIVLIPITITALCIGLLLFPVHYITYTSYLFALSAIGFVGLLDDLIGDKKVKGLKQHISSFLCGKLTTGLIKAFVSFITSFIISLIISNTIYDFMINLFLMPLFTNTLNLMDLRPGRCVKFFLLAGVVILVLNLNSIPNLIPLIIMLTTSVIYINYDLKELCMLGDTGSNILGITLGYFAVTSFEIPTKAGILVLVLCINIAAEKLSLSKLIERNKLLNYLDSLGRSSC